MSRYDVRYVARATAPDDKFAYALRRELSGGVNTRTHETEIGENQAILLQNVSLDTPGKTNKRPGCVLIGNDLGASSIVALHNYAIQGATDQLLCYEEDNLNKWEGSGNWAELKGDFTAAQTDVGIISAKESGQSPDDVVIVQNGTDAFRINSAGAAYDLTTANSIYLTTVMTWYGNRIWCLKDDLFQFSDAYPDLDSGADKFSSTAFRIPVGAERAVVSTRDTGMIIMGKDAVWGLNPSIVPDPATDKPQPIVPNHGVVSKKGWCRGGDDIFYFAQDGFRILRRTVQDKLQSLASYPVSYALKESFEDIDWTYIENLQMIYFDNKVFIAVPTGETTTDLWIYWTATNSFTVATGLNIRSMAKYKVDGEEQLFIGKIGDGVVHRAWYGYTDYGTTISNGTAIDYSIVTRAEDLGNPLIQKCGGEVEVVFDATGDYDITVEASFDNGTWRTLGTIDLSVRLITFPTTFPVTFYDTNVAKAKFHLDQYGNWLTMQLRISHNAVNEKDISLIRYAITSYLQQYENE